MFRKTIIAAAVLAFTPAIAFAAPSTPMPKEKPAVTSTVKAEEIKLTKAHHAFKKVKAAVHMHVKATAKINKA